MYIYDLISLKAYEAKLKKGNIEQLEYTENRNLFKYFSLLNDGDVSYLNELENKELEMLSLYPLEEFSTNEELSYIKQFLEDEQKNLTQRSNQQEE